MESTIPGRNDYYCCIDRLVHHATILELNTESYRMNAAKIAKNHSNKSTKTEGKIDVK